MLYSYVCDTCGNHVEFLRVMARRDDPVFCGRCAIPQNQMAGGDAPDHVRMHKMRREITVPTVHYKGAGWTRTPAIMKDPIAAGHPGQRSNWGVDSAADYGDPNLISPHKKIVNEASEDSE